MSHRALLPLLFTLLLPSLAHSQAWEVDASHSKVGFAVDHFFTPVPGHFGDYDVDFRFDADDPTKSSVAATIRVASIDSGNQNRDEHLLSADFFESDTHPTITFTSSSFRQVDEDSLVADGNLMIKGKRQRIELPIELLGIREIPPEMREMFGGTEKVASFEAKTTIDRTDFGVGVGSWAATSVVGDEVEITILLEAHWR